MKGGKKETIKHKVQKGDKRVDITKDALEIAKDLVEILVLILTARQLLKKKKSKKSKK